MKYTTPAEDFLKVLYITKDTTELRSICEDPDATQKYIEDISRLGDISEIVKEFEDKVIKPGGFRFETILENSEKFTPIFGDHVPVLAYKGDLEFAELGRINLFMEDDTIADYMLEHADQLQDLPYCYITQHEAIAGVTGICKFEMATGHVYFNGEEVLTIVGRKNSLIYLFAEISNQCLATQGGDIFVNACLDLIVGTATVFPERARFAIPGESGSVCNKLIKSREWSLADSINDFTTNFEKSTPKEK